MRTLLPPTIVGAIMVGSSVIAEPPELCFEFARTEGPCSPGDLLYDLGWVGYSTGTSACQEDGTSGAPCVLALSSSATDPLANEGAIPPDGRLYLWLVSSLYDSYGFAGLRVTIAGDLEILGYEPIAPDSYSWNDSTGALAWSGSRCLGRPPSILPSEVIGSLILEASGVDAGSWGRIKAMWR